MPYLNMDDGYPEHRKVERLSDGAFRLHASAMFYAARSKTDGGITEAKLRRVVPRFKSTQVTELLDAGLLHEPMRACDSETCRNGEPDEYVLHDFLQWNKSREWWDEKRAADAERKAKWRAEHAEREAS